MLKYGKGNLTPKSNYLHTGEIRHTTVSVSVFDVAHAAKAQRALQDGDRQFVVDTLTPASPRVLLRGVRREQHADYENKTDGPEITAR